MPLASHTLLFRSHTRVFLTLGIAAAAAVTFLTTLLSLSS